MAGEVVVEKIPDGELQPIIRNLTQQVFGPPPNIFLEGPVAHEDASAYPQLKFSIPTTSSASHTSSRPLTQPSPVNRFDYLRITLQQKIPREDTTAHGNYPTLEA